MRTGERTVTGEGDHSLLDLQLDPQLVAATAVSRLAGEGAGPG